MRLDPRSGRQSSLGNHDWAEVPGFQFHESKPWVAGFVRSASRGGENAERSGLAVVDLESGATLGVLSGDMSPGELWTYSDFQFVPGTDELFIVKRGRDEKKVAEIRRLQAGFQRSGEFPWQFDIETLCNSKQFSRTGLLAISDVEHQPIRTVAMEYRTGRIVFADPPISTWTDTPTPSKVVNRPPSLSADGRFLADEYSDKVWDLERNAIVEAPLAGEATFDEWILQKGRVGIDSAQNHFEATEVLSSVPSLSLWNRWIGERLSPAMFESPWRAVRDPVSRTLKYRCDEPTVVGFADRNGFNSRGVAIPSKRLFVENGGSVRSLDPTPRWGLIALLQATLAAPLVALWALLRWRRRRLAGAAT
jgi:hypothetical protein